MKVVLITAIILVTQNQVWSDGDDSILLDKSDDKNDDHQQLPIWLVTYCLKWMADSNSVKECRENLVFTIGDQSTICDRLNNFRNCLKTAVSRECRVFCALFVENQFKIFSLIFGNTCNNPSSHPTMSYPVWTTTQIMTNEPFNSTDNDTILVTPTPEPEFTSATTNAPDKFTFIARCEGYTKEKTECKVPGIIANLTLTKSWTFGSEPDSCLTENSFLFYNDTIVVTGSCRGEFLVTLVEHVTYFTYNMIRKSNPVDVAPNFPTYQVTQVQHTTTVIDKPGSFDFKNIFYTTKEKSCTSSAVGCILNITSSNVRIKNFAYQYYSSGICVDSSYHLENISFENVAAYGCGSTMMVSNAARVEISDSLFMMASSESGDNRPLADFTTDNLSITNSWFVGMGKEAYPKTLLRFRNETKVSLVNNCFWSATEGVNASVGTNDGEMNIISKDNYFNSFRYAFTTDIKTNIDLQGGNRVENVDQTWHMVRPMP